MKKIAVVGVGQLGSRHLQALAHCDFPVALFAVDPDATSRNIAQDRFQQIPNSENVRSIEFLGSIQQLPESLDLCVISTSSDIRLKVLEELVDYTQVQYVIFEKVIFQSPFEFLEAKKILRENGVSAWANFNKRMFKILRNVFKFGDAFFIRDPETKKLFHVDPAKVSKIIVNESTGKEPEQYIVRDINFNFKHLVATTPLIMSPATPSNGLSNSCIILMPHK